MSLLLLPITSLKAPTHDIEEEKESFSWWSSTFFAQLSWFNYCWCHYHCPLYHLRHQHLRLKKRWSPHHGGPQHSLHLYCGLNILLLLLMITIVLLHHWRYWCKQPMTCLQLRSKGGCYWSIWSRERRESVWWSTQPPFALIPWGTVCSWGSSTKSRIKTWLLRMPRWY